MICNECSKKISNSMRYCSVCGNELKSDMHIEYELLEYGKESSKLVKLVSKRLNLDIPEADFLTEEYLYNIHKEWVEEYQKKNGYKQAKIYLEEIERTSTFKRFNKYKDKNKYNEKIAELKIDKSQGTDSISEYTKKWNNAQSKEEEIAIENEAKNEIDKIYSEIVDNIEKIKPEFDEQLKKRKEKRDIEKAVDEKLQKVDIIQICLAAIWYFIFCTSTSWGILSKFSLNIFESFETLGVVFYLAFIVLGIYLLLIMYRKLEFLPYVIRFAIFPLFLPIIVIVALIYILGNLGKSYTEMQNEVEAPFVERKRQMLINDLYNRRYK